MDLSFSGAGFMGCYYFGVVDCWKRYVPRERINRAAGSSAGALIAAYYLCDIPLPPALKEIVGLLEDIRRRPMGVFDRSNQIVDVLPRVLDKVLPEDAHKRVSGKLFVCMTRLKDMKKVLVSEFESKADLIDALNCSSFIPVWSGNHVSTYKGVKHIDGGFADNLPVFDEHTIRICCFSGPTDISPYDRAKMELLSGRVVNMPLYINFGNCRRFKKALFPPPASVAVDLLERGFHDAKDFILSNDLIQCDTCYAKTSLRDQLIYSRISPTISPCASPTASRTCSFSNSLRPDLQTIVDPSGHLALPGAARGKDFRCPTFSSLVEEKLRSDSTNSYESALGSESPSEQSPAAPTILVEAPPGGQAEKGSLGGSSESSDLGLGDDAPLDESKGPRESPKPTRAPVIRRNTLQDSQPLVLKDRFTLAPNPLPSCPPSPNLNRHCGECIRMRQQARADLVGDDVRAQIERYRNREEVLPESKLKSRLTSPIKWLRQIGVKNSYKFTDTKPRHTLIV